MMLSCPLAVTMYKNTYLLVCIWLKREIEEFATKILLSCSSLFSYYFLHHTCVNLLIYVFYKHEVHRSEDEEKKKNLAEGVKKIKV